VNPIHWRDRIRLKKTFSVLVQFVGALLPAVAKRVFLRRVLGWAIGEDVRLGCSVILSEEVRLGDGARIGHGNLFAGLKSIHIGARTVLLNLNHFTGNSGRADTFVIGDCAKITSRHYFDCSGGISIGNRALIGGRDSQFWTHYFSFEAQNIEPRTLLIGEGCYICARSTLIYCLLPPGCVVAAGSVVTGDFCKSGAERFLLAGNPAIVKRRL
jgi:acetyltransferase-like isoleucine patch superfamily enzyme